MSTGGILGLGAIAGVTIFIGLPVGRMRRLSPPVRTLLNAVAIGILTFLVWDVLSAAVEPVEGRLEALTGDNPDPSQSWWGFLGMSGLMALGLGLGLLSLVYYDRLLPRRKSVGSASMGPGAAAVEEFRVSDTWASPGRKLALTIAIGIGLHNFAEGLAIGQAAATGAISLAVLLVIGFGLHNATEGFGIVGPMAGDENPPSWRLLGLLGLIGGAPTFLGTVLGQAWTSEAVTVAFFAIAAGSILYVVQELFNANRKYGHTVLVTWLVLAGLVLGFATDFVIDAAGI